MRHLKVLYCFHEKKFHNIVYYVLFFTGALYVILGHKEKTILTKHNWETCLKVWPALVLSRHSEKPSVSSLLDRSMKTIQAFIGERNKPFFKKTIRNIKIFF